MRSEVYMVRVKGLRSTAEPITGAVYFVHSPPSAAVSSVPPSTSASTSAIRRWSSSSMS